MITIQSNSGLVLLRKPSNIASTPGKELSIFDIVNKKDSVKVLQKSYDARQSHRGSLGISLQEHITNYGSSIDFASCVFNFELLCNRLDLPTSGYLLFAHDKIQKNDFEAVQKLEHYNKYYLARVVGDIRYRIEKNPHNNIKLPIMHHQSLEDRMTCVQAGKDRGRGKLHQVTSRIEFLSFDTQSQTSIIKVAITKGIRHQIRVHCSAIGYPILGDKLYGAPGKKTGELWLTSVGIEKKV